MKKGKKGKVTYERNKKGIKLIEVTWEDHWHSSSDWTPEELFNERNMLFVTTVGYLVAEDTKHLFINTQLEPTCIGAYRGINSIIKSCIKKVNFIGWRRPS